MSLVQMIQAAVTKQIMEQYAHVQHPSAVHAKITKIADGYNLKILDENGVIDDRFPEIPNVQSEQVFEAGDNVTILLMYGQLNPHIVGKAVIT